MTEENRLKQHDVNGDFTSLEKAIKLGSTSNDNVNNKKLYRLGNSVSEEVLVPVNDQILIRTVGVAPLLEVISNKARINLTMKCFIAGIGGAANRDGVELGSEVHLYSIDDHMFSRVAIPGTEKTINWYQANANDPELIIAKAVSTDKAKSKIALNHSQAGKGIDPNNAILPPSAVSKSNSTVTGKKKFELFTNKDVEVVEYYLTNVNNITAIYAKAIKEKE